MSKLVKALKSERIYKAIGPYSVATLVNHGSMSILHTSGLLGIDIETNKLVSDRTDQQAELCLKYLKEVVEENNASLEDIAKVTIFLDSMDDFEAVNKIYSSYFKNHYPARSCIQVAKLPKSAKIEIEAVAYFENKVPKF